MFDFLQINIKMNFITFEIYDLVSHLANNPI